MFIQEPIKFDGLLVYTIRKVMKVVGGGGGQYKKKTFVQGKNSVKKKMMHAK